MPKVKAKKAAKKGAWRRKAARPQRAKAPRDSRAIEASLAGLAHDIRTPLTGILALAELLSTSDLAERERQWANAIKSGAEHLASLTTLIVDAAKADAKGLVLRRETFPPRRLAEAVGRALAARAQTKEIKSEVIIARDLPAMVTGDPLRLRAALENLADNAVKFTDKGSVTFTAGAEPAAGKRVRLVFTVTDSGIGFGKKDMAKLFRPFAQASEAVARRYGGAGLGLVFVKRVARAMGGDLKVTSTPGKGSTFRMTVPMQRADVRPDASAKREGGARVAAGRGLTILCAEDNPYGRVVMNTILTELGHKIDFVETGEAAVKAVSRGIYDVVLMDIMLAGIDGIEAARCIRVLPGLAGRIPIIGISGRTEAGNEAAARAAGMNFYFSKPISPSRLSEALASVTS
ncbi:MAG: ATP-binding protein [Hyphomicrobiales bacterium]